MSAIERYDITNVDDWAARIATCWRESFEAIIATGRLIAEAKVSLVHGEFRRMCSERLPFGARTAQRLMAIAADHRIVNPTHVSLLPPHWGTLYELTRLDDDQFNRRIEDGTIRPDMDRKDISTAVKQTVRSTREMLLGRKQLSAPILKYGVIVEDFEWDHVTWSEKGKDRAAENHYPTSRDAHTAAEIVERTKDRFACADDNCVCFMWATLQHLAIAVDVLRLRGFEYKSSYAWGKDKIGLGYWSREKHEILLIGVKGKIDCPAQGTQRESLIIAPRGAHSAKPEVFLEMIEAYFPTLPKIELNRRGDARPGWDAWGNEAGLAEATAADTAAAPARELTELEALETIDEPHDDGLGIPPFLRRVPQEVA